MGLQTNHFGVPPEISHYKPTILGAISGNPNMSSKLSQSQGGGNNIGRVGTITHEEKHPGSFEMVHIKDIDPRVL